MRRELWVKVRKEDQVIYADEYEGVHKAKVIETDIRISEAGRPGVYTYPYGKTGETGTVRIQYDHAEIIVNLEQLIAYTAPSLAALTRAWTTWKRYEAAAAGGRVMFLYLVGEHAGR